MGFLFGHPSLQGLEPAATGGTTTDGTLHRGGTIAVEQQTGRGQIGRNGLIEQMVTATLQFHQEQAALIAAGMVHGLKEKDAFGRHRSRQEATFQKAESLLCLMNIQTGGSHAGQTGQTLRVIMSGWGVLRTALRQ